MSDSRISAGKVVGWPPGHKKMLSTDLENILVVNVDGQFYAVSNTCPHAGGWLNYGPLTGFMIECPLHYWPFDVRTGDLINMEGSGLEEQLDTYPVEVENGEVFVLLD